MDTNEFLILKWGRAFELRFKKLLLDVSSAKVWVLVAVIYGVYHGVNFDPWFYIFAAVVLGLKDMSKMILAFRGVKTSEKTT